MSSDPGGDNIESLLAADEATIRDDGFSKRVMDHVDRSPGVRRVAIYGAGLVGFGFAVGSLPALVRAMPPVRAAVDAAADARLPSLSRLPAMIDGSQTSALVLAAALAMSATMLVLALRER